jgi:hypothetical protein
MLATAYPRLLGILTEKEKGGLYIPDPTIAPGRQMSSHNWGDGVFQLNCKIAAM